MVSRDRQSSILQFLHAPVEAPWWTNAAQMRRCHLGARWSVLVVVFGVSRQILACGFVDRFLVACLTMQRLLLTPFQVSRASHSRPANAIVGQNEFDFKEDDLSEPNTRWPTRTSLYRNSISSMSFRCRRSIS